MSRPVRLLPVLALLAACGGDGADDPARSSVPLYLNEVVAANTLGCVDAAGDHDDWIELYNGGAEAVSLEGFAITDDPDDPGKHRFGAGLSIPADGVLVLWADGETAEGADHLSFKLKAEGESLRVFDPNGALVDEFSWTDAVDGTSLARLPDGAGDFASCAAPTCRAKNGAVCSD